MKKSIIEFSNKLRVVGITALLIAAVSTFQSCNREGCTDSTANNFDDKAKDDDGSCTYDRDAFIGTYNNTTDNCLAGSSFNMTIAESSVATNQILINNFGGFGQSVAISATVTGNSITLIAGPLGGGDVLLSGSGVLNGNLITINYTYEEQGTQFTCTINGTRS